MMGKIDKGFRYFCTVFLMILSIYILWQCGFSMGYAENLENVIQTARLPFFLFGLAAAGGILFCLTSRKLQRCNEKQLKWIAFGAFGCLFIGQLYFLVNFRTALRGDQMKVLEAAIELLDCKSIAVSSYNEYFSRCSNNIPLTLVTCFFLKIFRLLHLPQELWMDLAKLIGTVFLDGGVFFGYLLLRHLKNNKTAVLMLLLTIINPMMYLLTGVYYSSTISLFFGMGAIYFYFRGKEKEKRTWLFMLLTGIFLGFGFKIRATAFICGIALAIFAFFGWRNWNHVKQGMKNLCVTLAGFFAVLVLFSSLHNIYVQADYSDTEYTVLHYVMMGANGNGTYSPTDAAYTQKFHGKEAKIEANKERLFERLEEMQIPGVLALMGRKLTITFSDGTDDYYDAFNGVQGDASGLTYLNGSKRDLFAGYCHVYNTLLWMAILGSLVSALSRKSNTKLFVVRLAALGGIAFQLIWECGEAYSVPYIVLFLMMAAEGVSFVQESSEAFLQKKMIRRGSGVGVVLLFAAAVVWIIRAFNGIVLVNDDYRVRQTTYELSIHSSEDVVEQTFTASDAFNEIELYVYNIFQEHNQSVYQVTLIDKKGTSLASQLITGYMLPEYGSTYMHFDTITPDEESIYTIRIEAVEKDERAGIVFPYHSTGICDLYQGGSLFVNGAEKENCDLAFTVYQRSETSGIL